MNRRGKLPKYIWLPSLLAIYFIVMMIVYVPELYRKGEISRILIVSSVEILVIGLTYVFYKKREKLNK